MFTEADSFEYPDSIEIELDADSYANKDQLSPTRTGLFKWFIFGHWEVTRLPYLKSPEVTLHAYHTWQLASVISVCELAWCTRFALKNALDLSYTLYMYTTGNVLLKVTVCVI